MLNNFKEQLHNLGVYIMKNSEIKAVHDKDLESFLDSIDELESIRSEKRNCYFCGDIINLENIQSVFPLNHEVKYCCKKDSCYSCLLGKGETNA